MLQCPFDRLLKGYRSRSWELRKQYHWIKPRRKEFSVRFHQAIYLFHQKSPKEALWGGVLQ